MVQPITLDDFKNQKIPFYYKASLPKKIPLEVQNEKILEHLRTHFIYKFLAFIFKELFFKIILLDGIFRNSKDCL